MRKRYIWITLSLVLLFNVLIISKYQDQQKRFRDYSTQVNKWKAFRDLQLSYSVSFDNTPLEVDELQSMELCYFVSKMHCNQCVDSITTLIQDFKAANDKFHFRVLGNYESQQDLHLFKRLHGIDSSIIQASELNFPLLESDIPLFFIYDPINQTAQNVFAPDPYDPKMSLRYLELINDFLFR